MVKTVVASIVVIVFSTDVGMLSTTGVVEEIGDDTEEALEAAIFDEEVVSVGVGVAWVTLDTLKYTNYKILKEFKCNSGASS